jgi:hypothetical protein
MRLGRFASQRNVPQLFCMGSSLVSLLIFCKHPLCLHSVSRSVASRFHFFASSSESNVTVCSVTKIQNVSRIHILSHFMTFIVVAHFFTHFSHIFTFLSRNSEKGGKNAPQPKGHGMRKYVYPGHYVNLGHKQTYIECSDELAKKWHLAGGGCRTTSGDLAR